MMTREEIAAIDRECEQQHITQQEYLENHGIAKHQYYRSKHRYREEDEQSLVPGFVPMMSGAAPVQPVPAQRANGKQRQPPTKYRGGTCNSKVAATFESLLPLSSGDVSLTDARYR